MKKPVFFIAYLLITVSCSADTFTNKKTGEVFHGYATQEKKSSKTLVRIGDRQEPAYLELIDYDIEWNPSGRRNQIIILPIKKEIELECETEALEKAIKNTSNQGPLFILIEIDTTAGKVDLMKRICDVIIRTDNCRIVAFVSGGKYGGAYSAGAIIALACDYIYMADGTAIGAATPTMVFSSEIKDLKSAYGETVGEKFLSAERAYIATLAERKGRSALLAKAMVDREIEVLEVVEDGKTLFIIPEDKKESQLVQHILNKKGSLLTLTADKAVKCGMADKLLKSEEEIIAEFSFDKPNLIRNQDIIEAREKFESTKVKLEKIYNDIDYLRKNTDSLQSRFKSVDDSYDRAVRTLIRLKGRRRRHWRDIIRQKKIVEELSSQREILKSNLLNALQKLELKYKEAVSLGEDYPDLNVCIEDLNKEINSVNVLSKSFK